jgi:hypothetical protein
MNDEHLYNSFLVVMVFRDRLYGGIPKTKELLRAYVEGKFGLENGDLAENLAKEVDLIEETEKVTTGFKMDDGHPYLGDYQFKALMKMSARMLRLTTSKRGTKEDITHGLYVPPRLYLSRKGTRIEGPLPTEDFCGHVSTPQGKRSILKSSEYVEQASITFTARLIKKAKLTSNDFQECLLQGQEIGTGSNRSFEKGKYDLEKFEKL